jgi:hypothetical protein
VLIVDPPSQLKGVDCLALAQSNPSNYVNWQTILYNGLHIPPPKEKEKENQTIMLIIKPRIVNIFGHVV